MNLNRNSLYVTPGKNRDNYKVKIMQTESINDILKKESKFAKPSSNINKEDELIIKNQNNTLQKFLTGNLSKILQFRGKSNTFKKHSILNLIELKEVRRKASIYIKNDDDLQNINFVDFPEQSHLNNNIPIIGDELLKIQRNSMNVPDNFNLSKNSLEKYLRSSAKNSMNNISNLNNISHQNNTSNINKERKIVSRGNSKINSDPLNNLHPRLSLRINEFIRNLNERSINHSNNILNYTFSNENICNNNNSENKISEFDDPKKINFKTSVNKEKLKILEKEKSEKDFKFNEESSENSEKFFDLANNPDKKNIENIFLKNKNLSLNNFKKSFDKFYYNSPLKKKNSEQKIKESKNKTYFHKNEKKDLSDNELQKLNISEEESVEHIKTVVFTGKNSNKSLKNLDNISNIKEKSIELKILSPKSKIDITKLDEVEEINKNEKNLVNNKSPNIINLKSNFIQKFKKNFPEEDNILIFKSNSLKKIILPDLKSNNLNYIDKPHSHSLSGSPLKSKFNKKFHQYNSFKIPSKNFLKNFDIQNDTKKSKLFPFSPDKIFNNFDNKIVLENINSKKSRLLEIEKKNELSRKKIPYIKSNLSMGRIISKKTNHLLDAYDFKKKFPLGESSNIIQDLEDSKDEKNLSRENFRFLSRRDLVEDSLSDEEDYQILSNTTNEGGCLIEINSHFRKNWDFLISLITLYTLLIAPFKLAFSDLDGGFLDFVEMGMDCIFIIDIILQFFIPFYNAEEDLIRNKYSIAKNYLTTWFILDVLASIPGSIIGYLVNDPSLEDLRNSNNLSKINKVTRITKLYRVLKFTKLSKIIKLSNDKNKNISSNNIPALEEFNISSSIKRMLNFFLVFILVTHIITCIWIFIGNSSYPSWILKLNLTDASTGELYVTSLYFHWTTIFTIGYGDVLSNNTIERFYNCILMFVGVLIYSFAVTSLGTIVSTYDGLTVKFMKNMEQLQEISSRYNVPDNFYDKVYKYLKYDYKFNKSEKFSFINELPVRLKNSLLINMYRDVIKNFKFLKENTPEFTSKVVFMMKPLRLNKKEYIITEGEFLEEVIFVRKGYLSIHLGVDFNEHKIMEIRKNEHFGDILVLSNLRSPVTIKVGSKLCDLLIIRKQDLLEIAADFPESIEEIFLVSSFNFSSLMEMIDLRKHKIEMENLQAKNRKNEIDNFVNINNKSFIEQVNGIGQYKNYEQNNNNNIIIDEINKKLENKSFNNYNVEESKNNSNEELSLKNSLIKLENQKINSQNNIDINNEEIDKCNFNEKISSGNINEKKNLNNTNKLLLKEVKFEGKSNFFEENSNLENSDFIKISKNLFSSNKFSLNKKKTNCFDEEKLFNRNSSIGLSDIGSNLQITQETRLENYNKKNNLSKHNSYKNKFSGFTDEISENSVSKILAEENVTYKNSLLQFKTNLNEKKPLAEYYIHEDNKINEIEEEFNQPTIRKNEKNFYFNYEDTNFFNNPTETKICKNLSNKSFSKNLNLSKLKDEQKKEIINISHSSPKSNLISNSSFDLKNKNIFYTKFEREKKNLLTGSPVKNNIENFLNLKKIKKIPYKKRNTISHQEKNKNFIGDFLISVSNSSDSEKISFSKHIYNKENTINISLKCNNCNHIMSIDKDLLIKLQKGKYEILEDNNNFNNRNYNLRNSENSEGDKKSNSSQRKNLSVKNVYNIYNNCNINQTIEASNNNRNDGSKLNVGEIKQNNSNINKNNSDNLINIKNKKDKIIQKYKTYVNKKPKSSSEYFKKIFFNDKKILDLEEENFNNLNNQDKSKSSQDDNKLNINNQEHLYDSRKLINNFLEKNNSENKKKFVQENNFFHKDSMNFMKLNKKNLIKNNQAKNNKIRNNLIKIRERLRRRDSTKYKKSAIFVDKIYNSLFYRNQIMRHPEEYYFNQFKILFTKGLEEELKCESSKINSILPKILSLGRFSNNFYFNKDENILELINQNNSKGNNKKIEIPFMN